MMRIPIYNRFVALQTQLPKYLTLFKNKNITPILDYCMEFDNNHQKTTSKILNIMEKYPKNYYAIKLTSLGLNDFDINSTTKNLNKICEFAYITQSKVLIDAENVKYQDNINTITNDFIKHYNKNVEIPLVFKTYQMYRKDSFQILKEDITDYKNTDVKLGIKMVRGAYYHEDKDSGLLYNNIEDTHKNYDIGINYLFNNFENIQDVIFATHNQDSIRLLKLHSSIHKIPEYFIKYASLTGMNDKTSESMNSQGYLVMKYLPFGPFFKTMPYLSRRLYENYEIIRHLKN